VVTIGAFHAGDAPNVIPGEAELDGTARSFDPACASASRADRGDRPRRAGAHGAQSELEYSSGYSAVVNDATPTELVRAVVPRRS
jgi:metal-dependent amidase/aminoacylase/carboxypeptidase family protein